MNGVTWGRGASVGNSQANGGSAPGGLEKPGEIGTLIKTHWADMA